MDGALPILVLISIGLLVNRLLEGSLVALLLPRLDQPWTDRE